MPFADGWTAQMIIFNFVTDTDSWPMIVLVECKKTAEIAWDFRKYKKQGMTCMVVPSGCAERNAGANPIAEDRAEYRKVGRGRGGRTREYPFSPNHAMNHGVAEGFGFSWVLDR